MRRPMSLIDAVDGSSTRHVSAMEVGAVKAPTIRRSYPCKRSRQLVSISPSRSFRFMASMRMAISSSAGRSSDATYRPFPEAAAVPCRHRSLRLVALLVARTPGAWPYRSPDAAGLCEALPHDKTVWITAAARSAFLGGAPAFLWSLPPPRATVSQVDSSTRQEQWRTCGIAVRREFRPA
jgi:hypothetical protein